MEKTWNKLKKSLTSKKKNENENENSIPSSSSSTANKTGSSSRSRTFSITTSSSSTTSRRPSKETLCAICLENMKPGKGHAIFTAECSHTFHFSCIASNVKHGNKICPVCRSTWKDVPFQTPNDGARVTPIILPYYQPAPPRFEPDSFSDDEPILHVETSSDSASPLSVHQLVTIRAFPEFPAVLATDSLPAFSVLVGVQAPTLTEEARQHARAPVDLVAVLDVSGSMNGTKLALLKRAVCFVIDNLGPADRLSIISFSSRARRIFPLRRMSNIGRESATLAINSLTANGGTNISEGLKKAVQVLEERRAQNPVASIILLSDGRDNYSTVFDTDYKNPENQAYYTSRWVSYFVNLLPHAICPPNGTIVGEGRLPPIPVHTFGIGTDHDASCMHAISDVSGGTFSFIQDANIIQDAFARCIGGLLSVVAQQLKLRMSAMSNGVKISLIPSGKHPNEISSNGETGIVDIEDLYADEEKAFMVQISVPAALSKALDATTPLLSVECSYKNIALKEIVKVENVKVTIRRPQTLSSEDSIVHLEVDRQRNRLLVMESIAEAQAMAEKGNISGAQTVLESRRLALLSSASAQAGDALCKWLEAELKEIRERMRTRELYEESGRAYTLSGMSSHSTQRATTRGDQSNTHIRDGYETTSMTTMVMRSQTTTANIPRPNKSSCNGQARK